MNPLKKCFFATLLATFTLYHVCPNQLLADASKINRWALLIGVNDYSQIEPLQFCSRDMKSLSEQLITSGFPKNQVFLLHDKAEENKYRPFKANIEKQLNLVLSLAERGDLIVVAFSGHGVHLDGKSYLCPAEAQLSRPKETMVSLETVYDSLRTSKASLKVLLVDACRNDPRRGGSKSLKPTAQTKKFAASLERPPTGILLMASCAPGQISMEEKSLGGGHGVFMNYVLQGLRGDADADRSGAVSLLELYKFANRNTKTFVARKFNELQTPYLKGEIHDDFDLSKVIPKLPRYVTNSIGMKLRLIPAGEFMMGSSRSAAEIARLYDTVAGIFEIEHPQHRVRISQPFYLGTTEVSQGQWQALMGTRPWSRKLGVKDGRDYPASHVSWEDAVEFCRKLSKKEGVTYRLLTEAEWEYACRAGSRTMYSFGDDVSQFGDYAWYYDNILMDLGRVHAHEVATKRPNAWGLYDMHGNVHEWCSDWYDFDYYAASPQTDPSGPSSGSDRVNRGGSWIDKPYHCRSAYRHYNSPDYRYHNQGFRVVRSSVGK